MMKILCIIVPLVVCVSDLTQIMANENVPPSGLFGIRQQDSRISKAIYHLEKACSLCKASKDKWAREVVFGQIKSCQDCIEKAQLAKNYDRIEQTSIQLYENIGEILSECQDTELMDEVTKHINAMMSNLEQ